MTNLERLIREQVRVTTVKTVSTATDKVAEELAREILKDPAWRLQMRQLIERHAHATMRQLLAPANGRKPRRRRRRPKHGT
jgi:hypothetical protein